MAENSTKPVTKIQENSFENDIQNCLTVLNSGGTILIATDTVWGLGCDATNVVAVEKVLQIKQRSQAQGLIVLLADEKDLKEHVTLPEKEIGPVLQQQQKTTTIIYEGGKNVAPNILPEENTLAIRIVKDAFCQELINRFGKPIVSTSANIHGQPTPQNFSEISSDVIKQVDYVVHHRQQERNISLPSTILKIRPDGLFEVIRP